MEDEEKAVGDEQEAEEEEAVEATDRPIQIVGSLKLIHFPSIINASVSIRPPSPSRLVYLRFPARMGCC